MNQPTKMGRPVQTPESENIVARARAQLGYSQLQLAELIRSNRTSVTHWETGRYSVPGPVEVLCELILAGVDIIKILKQ